MTTSLILSAALLLNFIPTLQVPLPPSGLLIHLTHHDIILRCTDPCLRLDVPPPRALRLRSHVWVPGGPRGEFCRPFLKQHKAPAAAAAEAAAAPESESEPDPERWVAAAAVGRGRRQVAPRLCSAATCTVRAI